MPERYRDGGGDVWERVGHDRFDLVEWEDGKPAADGMQGYTRSRVEGQFGKLVPTGNGAHSVHVTRAELADILEDVREGLPWPASEHLGYKIEQLREGK